MRDMSAKEAADRLRILIGEIPDAENLEVGYTLNQSQPEIELAINHPDLDMLRAAVDDLKAQLGTYDEVFNIRDSLQTAMEELQFELKPGARELGFTLADVTRQVRQPIMAKRCKDCPAMAMM